MAFRIVTHSQGRTQRSNSLDDKADANNLLERFVSLGLATGGYVEEYVPSIGWIVSKKEN